MWIVSNYARDLVSELVRINNGEILKIMNIIASHTDLTLEEACHKGMAGLWRKILYQLT